MAVWMLHGKIVGDEAGLRWRRVGGWCSVSWAEVADYYRGPRLEGTPSVSYIVETHARRLCFRKNVWSATGPLLDLIERKATSAKVKHWGVKGTRPEDAWPRTFSYPVAARSVLLWAGMIFLVVAPFLAANSRENDSLSFLWQKYTTDPGRIWNWAVASMFFLLCSPALALMAWQHSLLLGRRHQQIEVSLKGIVFEKPGERIEATWADVTDYYLGHRQRGDNGMSRIVETRSGSFSFSPDIQDFAVLRDIVSRYATNATSSEWRSLESDALGGVKLSWSEGHEGGGQRIFHYRTKSLRSLLWLPALFALTFPLTIVGDLLFGLPVPTTGVSLFWLNLISLVWAIVGIRGWLVYRLASIRIDDREIVQYNPLGQKQSLSWQEVTDYQKKEIRFTVSGPTQTIRFSALIADLEELKAEIARRAVNSRNLTWDEAGLAAAQDG